MKATLFCVVALFAILAISSTEAVPGGPVCACPRIYRPVCASNGRTYGNECEFKCAAQAARSEHLRVVRYGRCDGEDEPRLKFA
ncbi:hypothetical protein ILUMI_08213 [Ignelater luminosus]|uniref:Kazal-like domain-containing protein n=1 Tax=Ignelater luminosus TaxID=2038154 RepID=A0A8K0GG51_IGNLU|nr:hypothetical protein ILUMI_08213 [Ignelater luminosus]